MSKAIYLDVDIVVGGSLSKFWNQDISDYMLGAVEDFHYMKKNDYKEKIGLEKTSIYYNAGVLLMNLEKMRSNDISSNLIKSSVENLDIFKFEDQDALNIVCKNKILKVSEDYNYQQTFINKCKIKLKHKKTRIITHNSGPDKKYIKNISLTKGLDFKYKILGLKIYMKTMSFIF